MTTLKERMEDLSRATGWDVGKIAQEAGVSSSAVSQWFGKGSKIIHSIGIMPAIYLERATGFNAMWLSKGELPKMAGDTTDGSSRQKNWKNRATTVTFEDAVRVITESLAVVDESTRRRVMSVLADLATEPDDHERIAKGALALLESGKRKSA